MSEAEDGKALCVCEEQATEVAGHATCVNDLSYVAEIVGRLRLDGRVIDMATFEALALRGEIAVTARQLDWRDVAEQRQSLVVPRP